jgi:hypothetical protein
VAESILEGRDSNVKEEVKHNGVMKRQWKLWLWSAFVGFGVGAVVAALAMWAAWSHNMQGEIYNEVGIDWLYWLLIGLSWFLPSSFVCTLIVRPLPGLLAYVFNVVIANEAKQ